MAAICAVLSIYTMRQKFSIFSNPNFSHDQICARFYKRFIGRALYNFTFHGNFARFTDFHGLPRDVEEIMQITCPEFHVYPMLLKYALTDWYMYQNKITGVKLENFMMGRRPESTFSKHKLVIGVIPVGMTNKQIVRHFQACESTISPLRTKIRQMGSVENRKPCRQIM